MGDPARAGDLASVNQAMRTRPLLPPVMRREARPVLPPPSARCASAPLPRGGGFGLPAARGMKQAAMPAATATAAPMAKVLVYALSRGSGCTAVTPAARRVVSTWEPTEEPRDRMRALTPVASPVSDRGRRRRSGWAWPRRRRRTPHEHHDRVRPSTAPSGGMAGGFPRPEACRGDQPAPRMSGTRAPKRTPSLPDRARRRASSGRRGAAGARHRWRPGRIRSRKSWKKKSRPGLAARPGS